MIVLIKNKVRLEGKKVYIEASKKMAKETEKVDGCISSTVLLSDVEDEVINLEVWKSKEAFDKYDGSAFLKYKAELKPNFLGNTTEIFQEA
ncbi:MAG: antibiotic biosynthesis monooxygenase family protein [Bacillota bacterium]|nr:antibiotic biosynthesis monooxygenase family protein [Bacillota bacterium]